MSYDLAGAKRALHAECRARGLDEDARRHMIRTVGGVASGSTKDLDERAVRRVLEHLRATGGASPARARASKMGEWAWIEAAPEANRPLLCKIVAVCGALHIEKGRQQRYAEGVAKRQHGIERQLSMMSYGELWKVAGALQRTLNYKSHPPAPLPGEGGDEGSAAGAASVDTLRRPRGPTGIPSGHGPSGGAGLPPGPDGGNDQPGGAHE